MRIHVATDHAGLELSQELQEHLRTAGHEVIGIRRGWGGLLLTNRDDPASLEKYIMPLDYNAVRTIDRTGGTMLHTSRTNPGKVKPRDVPDFLKDPEHPEAEAADTNTRSPIESMKLTRPRSRTIDAAPLSIA